MSASRSKATTNTTNETHDRRLTTGAGDILNITDSPMTIGDGGVFSVTSSDAEVAQSALETAKELSAQSNTIAAGVADSQRAFVESASGQKTWIYGAAIIAAVLLFRGKSA